MDDQLTTCIFDFNDRVMDRISGFEGVVIARAEFRYGENSYLVAATDGGKVDEQWIVESRLQTVPKKKAKKTSSRR